MYGEEKLNAHFILRYSLTKEFFEAFGDLKLHDIELPPIIIRKFHSFIEDYVNDNLSNIEYIKSLQRKHNLYSVLDAQRALKRIPKQSSLPDAPNRNVILLPGRMASIALNHFPDNQIMLLISNKLDQHTIDSLNLSKKVQVLNYAQKTKEHSISKDQLMAYRKSATKLLKENSKHPIFKEPNFNSWLLKNIKYALINVELFEDIIKKYPIKIIINNTEINNPGTTISLIANKYNLPFVYLAEDLNSTHSFIPSRATHYCVWGENYKDWIRNHGVSDTSIIETGNIRFEKAMNTLSLSKKAFLDNFKIDDKTKIVTYTTQPLPEANKIILKWIIKFIKSNKINLTFLIKPHRNDNIDYSKILDKFSNIVILSDHINLYDVLRNSDFVMTISSTTSIEAAMFGKGILILQPNIKYQYDKNNNEYHSHLVKAEAGPSVYNYTEFTHTLNKLADDSNYRQLVNKMGANFLSKTINLEESPSTIISTFLKSIL